MKVEVGSKWKCIDEASINYGLTCIVKSVEDNPNYNGDGDMELEYSDGSSQVLKYRNFMPNYTHVILNGGNVLLNNKLTCFSEENSKDTFDIDKIVYISLKHTILDDSYFKEEENWQQLVKEGITYYEVTYTDRTQYNTTSIKRFSVRESGKALRIKETLEKYNNKLEKTYSTIFRTIIEYENITDEKQIQDLKSKFSVGRDFGVCNINIIKIDEEYLRCKSKKLGILLYGMGQ